MIVGVYDKFRPSETQTVTSVDSVYPSGGNAGVYSGLQTVIKVPNDILR